jgi:hypothetical protein
MRIAAAVEVYGKTLKTIWKKGRRDITTMLLKGGEI